MNVNDSEIMSGLLTQAGYLWTENPEDADIVLINSCAVREKAENKMYGTIGQFLKIKKSRKLIIGVGGCSAEKEGKAILERFDGVDFVFGTRNITDIVTLIQRAQKHKRFVDLSDKLDCVSHELPKNPTSRHHAWITIIYGCNKYCTYCIVPYTRGLEKSRPYEDIINEVYDYAAKGYREITFLGQNVDSYGKDFSDGKPKLDLLIKKVSEIEEIKRVWFLTSYPTDITDSLIDEIAASRNAARNVHLPVQAGSDSILKSMNRRYTRQQFIDLVKKVKDKIPSVTISSDIIVGFPGETEEDFQQTVDLIKECRFERVNLAEYSPRQGTIAYKYKPDNIAHEEKNRRLMYLMELQKEINREENEKYRDKLLRIIPEAKASDTALYGRTMNNKIVIFNSQDASLIGKFADIKIKRITAGPLYGEMTKNENDAGFDIQNDPTFMI